MKKILIIDDSALMRRVLSVIIDKTNEYMVSYTASNGVEGLEILERCDDISVCLCDINMPRMDGLELLEVVRKKNIKVPFVVISSSEYAKDTITALELGAIEFIKKPKRMLGETDSAFVGKLTRALDMAVESRREHTICNKRVIYSEASNSKTLKHSGGGKLVALVCSTGGPKALQHVIPKLPKNLSTPVLVVQHMPAGFTNTMALRLNDISEITVKEAEDGEYIRSGVVYIARGGTHLTLQQEGKQSRIVFDDSPPVMGLKPCGNIMYNSLINSFYDEIICVVLTGMGADGTKGIRGLAKTNDIFVIAQDENSSTVYGMPKAVYEAGLTDCVCDINDIANEIVKKVGVL